MTHWIPFTFVRTTAFLIGGIVTAVYFPLDLSPGLTAALLTTGALLYATVVIIQRKRKLFFVNPGYIGLPLIFLAGFVHTIESNTLRSVNHFNSIDGKIDSYIVTITSYVEEKDRTWKASASVDRVHADKWHKTSGSVMLYFDKNEFKDPPVYGDVFMVRGRPTDVPPRGNPHEFDYKKFLAFKNIHHQQFIRSKICIKIGNDPPSLLLHYAIETRLWATSVLKKFIPGEREQAIAAALVLGVTDHLDSELLSAYAATGTLHVLAVSGLHISIIYLIIAWLLKPLSGLRSGSWIIAIVSLVILWVYAFVTGLSPSVLRAVTMFSFLTIARPLRQSTNIYNTLAVSAFCILMVDPFLIMSVGFQLSYLAVIGIVYLHPTLYCLWEPQSRVLDEVWKITSVSVAAQIATLPLGLLYFHQFPNYFWLSNLIIIPGSFVVLVGGLLLVAIGSVGILASWLGIFLSLVIQAMNGVVFYIERLPFSVIDSIDISPLQSVLLFLITVFVLLLFERKRYAYLVASVIFISGFFAISWHRYLERSRYATIVVYKVPGNSAVDFINGRNAWFMCDSILLGQYEKISFHIKPNRLNAGVELVSSGELPFVRRFKGAELAMWQGLTICRITENDFEIPQFINADWVIISNNSVATANKLPESTKNSKIILDSSNSFYFAERFLKESSLMSVDVYSVLHQGAFEFQI